MNVLVTGAAGFIGSHLCERLLAEGNKIIGIDNFDSFYAKSYKERNIESCLTSPSFSFIEGDAGSHAVLEKVKDEVDVVIHMAAKAGVQPSLANPQDYIEANVLVTNKLLEWMRQRRIRKFIFASSSSIYGNTQHVPFSEDQPVNEPFSPYAFTKRSCELMNYTYHTLYGMDVINLRFFTVYGERQRPDLAIHKFVRNILNGDPILMYGDGSTARDYTYVLDTVAGIEAALHYIIDKENIYEILNLGNSSPVALKELIHTIGDLIGIEPDIIMDSEKPGDVSITYADISRARSVLGYQPKTNLRTGLQHFINWYKNNIHNQRQRENRTVHNL